MAHMSDARQWNLGGPQYLTIDLDARRVTWEHHGRGAEDSFDLPLDAFVEHGPDCEVDLPRKTALEVLRFLGRERTPWCDPLARLTLRIGDATLPLHAYPRPRAYGGGLEHAMARITLAPDEFFARYGLASGVLAEDAEIGGVVLARDTDVFLHRSGRLHWGTLAVATTLNGVAIPAGARVTFDEAGALTHRSS